MHWYSNWKEAKREVTTISFTWGLIWAEQMNIGGKASLKLMKVGQHWINIDLNTHVLVDCVKSLRVYYIKSPTTLFSDNIRWNFEISFPCARFNSLLGYTLITKIWYHQKWDFQTHTLWNWKQRSFLWYTSLKNTN